MSSTAKAIDSNEVSSIAGGADSTVSVKPLEQESSQKSSDGDPLTTDLQDDKSTIDDKETIAERDGSFGSLSDSGTIESDDSKYYELKSVSDSTKDSTSEPMSDGLDSGSDPVADGDSTTDKPLAPEDDTVTTLTANIQWHAPAQRENGDYLKLYEIAGYEVQYREVGAANFTVLRVDEDGSGTQSVSIEVMANSEYELLIASYDIDGLYSDYYETRIEGVAAN